MNNVHKLIVALTLCLAGCQSNTIVQTRSDTYVIKDKRTYSIYDVARIRDIAFQKCASQGYTDFEVTNSYQTNTEDIIVVKCLKEKQ